MHMQMFFDYDQDLAVFESLMPYIDDAENLLEAEGDEEAPTSAPETTTPEETNSTAEETSSSGDLAAEPDKKEDPGESKENRIKGSLVTSAIADALKVLGSSADKSDTEKAKIEKVNKKAMQIRNRLFRNSYSIKPVMFILAKVDGITIRDNRNAKSYFEQKDDNIIVNLSELVRRYTRKSFDETIKSNGSWKGLTDPSIFSPYDEAVKKALNKLEKIIDSGVLDLDAPENQKGYKKPKKDDKLGQSVPPDDNNQQNPPDEQPPVEPPPDVEPPADDDQRAIYQQILKDFRDTYQMQLEADCDAKKHELTSNGDDDDDERDPDEEDPNAGIRDELITGCYQPLMKPYMDKADDDTQEKVKRVVAFYVDKYLGTPENGDKKDAGNDDGDGTNGNPNKNEEPDTLKKPDGGSWYANTMADMQKKDYHNHQLYVNPKLQDHGTSYNNYKAWYEKQKAKKKADKEKAKEAKKAMKEGKQPSNTLSQPKQQPKKQPQKDDMDWS